MVTSNDFGIVIVDIFSLDSYYYQGVVFFAAPGERGHWVTKNCLSG